MATIRQLRERVRTLELGRSRATGKGSESRYAQYTNLLQGARKRLQDAKSKEATKKTLSKPTPFERPTWEK